MAFVAVKPLPASSFVVLQRPGLGFGRARQSSLARVALPALRLRLQSSVRCSAEDGEGAKTEVPEVPEVAERLQQESAGEEVESRNEEAFGGWSAVDSEPEQESGGSWKAGVMRVGAGFVLAIGVSLISYSYFQKQGKKLAQSPSPEASTQESKVVHAAPPPQETNSKTSSPEADYLDDDVTFDDFSKKAGSDDFDEELEESTFADKHQDERERKKQAVSNRIDQNDEKAVKEFDSDTQVRDWKVVVPAFVDRMQELAVSALQALKVVEDGIDPGAVCTRRHYARWLIATSSILTRSSANKVLPAMYIEEETELAFDDVTPEDPDFAAIQGLAEAGLIPSNLSSMDTQSGEDESGGVLFNPDSPLSRQDLVSWKVALDRRSLPDITKEDFEAQSGFMDVDRIDSIAWPAIVSDLYSGDNSIITTAFGFTRMFQPQKPATNGQAAIALTSGDTSEQLGEEMARLEAEKMADEAVAADAVMEARTQKEVKALFDGEIETERKLREEAEKRLEEVKSTLEKVTAERESEKESLLKSQAAVEAQKSLLQEIQQKVDEQLHALATIEVEVSYEKERLKKLTAKLEEDQESAARLKWEIDSEKKALVLARLSAEEEAQRARAQAKVLEEARQRWASQGIEVNVDKSFDEDNIPGPSWSFSGGNSKLEKMLQRAPLQDVMEKGEDLKTRVNNGVIGFWHAILEVLSRFYHRILELLGAIRWRASELSQGTFTTVSHRVQDTGSVVAEKFRGAQSAVSDISAGAVDGTKRFADGCRSEIGKITQRFKHD
ncbi:hypothetical protein M758_3G036200 [Ceratodon purpureus]|nr:hypothetical protein M758_3G036200 [Ceratodon purpureus]